MTQITLGQLTAAWQVNPDRAMLWLEPINAAMDAFSIDNPKRKAAFLAQIGHESGRGQYVREIWGPTAAQSRYEGRLDLGNTQPGDGSRYRGRGLIQVTGRTNYRRVTNGLKFMDAPDFEQYPSELEKPKWAAMSAGWFWSTHGLNDLADTGQFTLITRRINGGTNGLEDRRALYAQASKALGIEA